MDLSAQVNAPGGPGDDTVILPVVEPDGNRPNPIDLRVIAGIAVLVIVQQTALILGWFNRFVSDDWALLWTAAESWGRLQPEQPNFWGQAYGSTLESIPTEMLQKEACDSIFCLYNHTGLPWGCDKELASYMKFDEYKYSIAHVPFERKWKLKLQRNMKRERDLFDCLNTRSPYICVHDHGSNRQLDIEVPDAWAKTHQVIKITPLTDNVFDWLYTLEHADKLLLLDSCFANLVEQLNLPVEKYLILRTRAPFTPVFRNDWSFVLPENDAEGRVTLRQV
jgi:hypothetical protein